MRAAAQPAPRPFFRTLAAALGLIVLTGGIAHATVAKTQTETSSVNLPELREVVETIARDEGLTALTKSCAADVFERDRPWWRRFVEPDDVAEDDCAKKPKRCLDRCLKWSNSEACFSLAQVIGHNGDVVEKFQKEALFSKACALGMGAGCTNRAAGIRNGDYEKDPFRQVAEPEKNACLFRSFKVDCEKEGAWGCAMLGQAYQLGEGTEADLTKAREAFEKSCEIDEDFASCDFAREGIEAMDKPVEIPDEMESQDGKAEPKAD